MVLAMSCKLAQVIFIYVLLQFPRGSRPNPTGSQAPIMVTAVEGISTNLEIFCGLDREGMPLYWNINGSIFDLYSVPTIFRTNGHGDLVIPTIDRELNNWTFQCFMISEKGLHRSQVTLLTVIHIDGGVRPVNFNPRLDPSQQGRLLLDYQNLATNSSMLRWRYHNVSCTVTTYRVDMYNESATMSAESEEQLEPFIHVYSTSEAITIPYDQVYVTVSALNTSNSSCARTDYLTGILGNRSEIQYHEYNANNTSASFDIPQGSNSLQLIWSKDDNTQCVCPPVEEIISKCACNRNNTSNFITISGGRLTISNLADEDHVMLYFTSASSGCGNRCNIRSIRTIYKIVIQQVHFAVGTEPNVTGYPSVSSKAGSNLLTCYNVILVTIAAVLLNLNMWS